MIDWINNISPSIILGINGVILALMGVWFSRKKDKAEMTTKNIQGARIVWGEYEKKMAHMQGEIDQLRRHSSGQSSRISSLEHNEKENQKWIGQLERMTERLQKENKELRHQYDELLDRYRALKVEVEHGSKPDLRLEGS